MNTSIYSGKNKTNRRQNPRDINDEAPLILCLEPQQNKKDFTKNNVSNACFSESPYDFTIKNISTASRIPFA
ncbi:hypothetical protein CBR65_07640 [Cellvibrio sp. PSBB006]|nr:hypothetical protein CBR65_07640 [Cellvibrio sp. PSBB006]